MLQLHSIVGGTVPQGLRTPWEHAWHTHVSIVLPGARCETSLPLPQSGDGYAGGKRVVDIVRR